MREICVFKNKCGIGIQGGHVGRKKRHKSRHFAFFVLISIVFVIVQWDPPLLDSWSSWYVADYVYSTGSHQGICRAAFDLLRRHPAFTNEIAFPALQSILEQSWVDMDKNGPGPDNYHNVPYSQHVYNPRITAGNAPKTIAEFYRRLREELEDGPSNDLENPPAPGRNAAFLAHFIQDLSVPYHVLGMPESHIPQNARTLIDVQIRDSRYTGPGIPGPSYALLFSRYDEDHGEFPQNADWFDPWYYDGIPSAYTVNSSHFTYEKDVLGIPLPAPPSGYSEEWKQSETIEEFAKQVALRTRNYVDSRSDVFDPRSTSTVQLLGFAARDTYTLWRASFCALRIRSIELEKVPNQEFTFRLKIGILNAEPQSDAMHVDATYEMTGGQTRGNGGFRRIGIIPKYNANNLKSCTAETLSDNVIRLNKDFFDNPSGTSGKIKITIKGEYDDAPDSGEWKEEIPLSMLGDRMTKLINLKEFFLESALAYLAPFDVDAEKSPESPDELRLANTVRSQVPDPGTWIGPGDKVKISYYGEYQEVRVPPVVRLTVAQARRLIEKNLPPSFMKPLLRAVTVPPDAKPEEIVIKQTPAPETRVPLGSDVVIFVKETEVPPDNPPDIPDVVSGREEPDIPDPADPNVPLEGNEKGPIQVANLVINPSAPVLIIGANNTAVLTVDAYDMEGNKITGEDLSRINFQWYMQDASLAYVAGSGQTAFVNVLERVISDLIKNPDKVLKVTAVCSTGTALETAVITVRMGDPTEDWGKVSERKEKPGEEDWAKISEKKVTPTKPKQSADKKYSKRTTDIAGTWTSDNYGTVVRVIKKGNVYSGFVVKNNHNYEHYPYDPWEKIWILGYAGKDDIDNNRYVGQVKRKYKHWRGGMVVEWHKAEFVTMVLPEVDELWISFEKHSVGISGRFFRKNAWVPKWLRDLRKKK